MKKDNDNEERLIETIVTIGTLIFFGLLSMYAMRGCSYDEGVLNSESSSSRAVALSTATAAAGVAAGAVTTDDNELTNGVALSADINESTIDTNVSDISIQSDETAATVMDMDENSTVEDNKTVEDNNTIDTNTTGDADDNKSTDDKNVTTDSTDSSNTASNKDMSEAEEEAGILADINNERLSEKPYILKGIYFRSGSSVLTKKSKRQLDAIAKALIEHKSVKVTIRGHTDSKGSKEANKRLSFKRATSTGMALVERGVNIDNIWIDGMGETEPITKNGTEEEMLLNRRVDIAVTE